MDALLVVDLQNDFCPGGALPVDEGDLTVPGVAALAREAPFVVATRDWHPPDHGSFDREGGPWPPHCIQGTPGAELVPDLPRSDLDVILDVGQEVDDDGYSGFAGTNLEQLLKDHGVRDLHVVGLALDVCVRATALDAAKAGFEVTLHGDLTRPVDPANAERTLAELRDAGVTIV
jgi:nicotinamidase/pyrazinamidase